MTRYKEIDYIASKLSKEEILCQLAEEAAELAQAALKLRRALTETNPTPYSADAATDNFLTEIADVTVAKDAYFELIANTNFGKGTRGPRMYVEYIADVKSRRWVERLKAIEGASTNRAVVAPTIAPTDTPTASSKTRQEKFLEMFPKVRTDTDGTITFCPGSVKPDFDCPNKSWDYYSVDCRECRKKYWLAAEKEDSHD